MIVIETPPTPAEIFASADDVVPDRWSEVARVGAIVGGIPEPTLWQVLSPGAVFTFPHSHWHRLAIKCRSLVPFPGDEEPFKRLLDVYFIQELQTVNDEVLSVTVHPWWDSPEAYADAFPDGVRGPANGDHRSFTDSFLEGRQP